MASRFLLIMLAVLLAGCSSPSLAPAEYPSTPTETREATREPAPTATNLPTEDPQIYIDTVNQGVGNIFTRLDHAANLLKAAVVTGSLDGNAFKSDVDSIDAPAKMVCGLKAPEKYRSLSSTLQVMCSDLSSLKYNFYTALSANSIKADVLEDRVNSASRQILAFVNDSQALGLKPLKLEIATNYVLPTKSAAVTPSPVRTLALAPAPHPTLKPTIKSSPTATAAPKPVGPTPLPGNPVALCKDGSLSYAATHQGACSGHGGVSIWYR